MYNPNYAYANAGLLTEAGGALKGAENFLKQWAPVGLVLGIGIFFFGQKTLGVTGGTAMLIGLPLIAVGSYYSITNAIPSLSIGNVLGAQYAHSYAITYPMSYPVSRANSTTAPEVLLPRQIVTGKATYGSRNPIDDSNHIYANISDVY